jgi:transposase-like protein
MARKQGKVAEQKSEILRALPLACSDETAAVEFIEQLRWQGTPACPRCGDANVSQMASKTGERNARFLWRCYGCKRQFTVRIGSIFEDSRIPLRVWCHAFWRACSSKKGVSALQIHRETGVSYKSALFLMHRIRFAMAADPRPPKLAGIVEADETYVGGKPRNKQRGGSHWSEVRDERTTKTPVFAALERGGRVRVRPMERVTSATVGAALNEWVEPAAQIHTDESKVYYYLGMPWPGGHFSVNHSRGEYARGNVTTNTVEGFFSLLKRGLYGTFHSVSKKHLHRYCDEFAFRYNTRAMDDGERTLEAIRASEGKRLRYLHQSRA